MRRIRIEPLDITIEIEDFETLYEGLKKAGVLLENPCGGLGSCGGCGVWVDPPQSVPPTPHKRISLEQEKKGFRLACQAKVTSDITVRLNDNYTFDRQPAQETDRVLPHYFQGKKAVLAPAVRVMHKENGYFLTDVKTDDAIALKSWQSGFTPKGLAIDIGTTTMVVSLICLETGAVLASKAALNPQVAHGHDVLSRIQYARTPERQAEMAQLVRHKLNQFIHEACEQAGASPDEIVDICIGANTTMLQLAAQMDSASIGRTPFKFDITGGVYHPVSLFGLNANPAARVYLPPIMHAFVGTDISAGLVLCPGFFDSSKSVLFIDMGTNGEMCLNVKGRWFSVSTAAGPAFEGMGLTSGMRARDGAVEKVEYSEGEIKFTTIGNSDVKGVCGSGIVDFISVLLESGAVDASGRLQGQEALGRYYADLDGQPGFEYGKGIYLTQKDIRQIQLAKSAIRTGIDMILDKGGIAAAQLDRIYLAGGFGNYLNPFHMEKIGVFPEGAARKIVFCGNTSIEGAAALLLDRGQRERLEKSLAAMEYVTLAELPDFNKKFIANLDF